MNISVNLDYKVLSTLHERKSPLKVGDLARDLNLVHSTVGSCIKRLEKKNYVNYEAYHNVELTKKGEEFAKELIRHRQLIEILLYNELELNAEEAHRESEKLNLLFSCNLINKICEKYNHPTACPCGKRVLNSSTCHCQNIKNKKV
ncbi:MAG: metal-dependent transcriptional regulator [Promethearchaeia archaeon]